MVVGIREYRVTVDSITTAVTRVFVFAVCCTWELSPPRTAAAAEAHADTVIIVDDSINGMSHYIPGGLM